MIFIFIFVFFKTIFDNNFQKQVSVLKYIYLK